MTLDHRETVLLVTGGTRGIGLATALAYARYGARAILTHRWGSADEDEVRRAFREVGGPEPWIVEADVSDRERTWELMRQIAERFGRLDVFVSNAAIAQRVESLDDYRERGLFQSLRYSSWPTFEHLLAARAALPRLPRRVVVMSSDGADRYTPAYDFVAATKAVTETLARYVQLHLADEDVAINVLRSRGVRTASFSAVFGGFGAEFLEFLESSGVGDPYPTVYEVAEAALALGSGLFDGVRGQVVTVDRGSAFSDGVSLLYERAGGSP